MRNTITIELCQEDRKRLDELIGFAGLIVGELKAAKPATIHMDLGAVPAEEPQEEAQEAPRPLNPNVIMPSHPAEEAGAVVEPEPAEEAGAVVEPEPAEEPAVPQYTKEDVQALVQKLASPNSPEHKRAGAKAIVKSYGAKVSDIPADKYAEAMGRLTALDKEGGA
jgi:hypothetical protein